MKRRHGIIGLALALSALGFCASASALTLDEARTQGRLGETLDGYVALVKPDPEAAALAERINQARRDRYREIAEENQVPLDNVARLAGQKLVARARPGDYVRGINGLWLQKGQATP
ncbi:MULTISPECIES: YdbL family protein [Yersiniaceae]|uniref:YdbL family protein n=1 Tax=Nissabacter archeti TaxID=1917880 RepID=A0ABS5JMA2_9GAMM|nr:MULTISPECIES: YdbL family protein [Yersiniaceae]MBS0970909.1 YdbL family protein [Nissabacter archeti]MDV5139154.1 YdbL family protein [Chimaeribacter arupi]